MKLKLFLSSLFIIISAGIASADDAGLRYINTRGTIRCGVPSSNKFWAYKDEKENLQGIGVEICRLISTAVFGRGDRVSILTLPQAMVDKAFAKNKIDVMIGGLPFSASNEISTRAAPIDVIYYEPLVFLAQKGENAKSMKYFEGEKVCIVKDPDTEKRLQSYNNRYDLKLKFMPFVSFSQAKEAFFLNRCRLVFGSYNTLKNLEENNPSKIDIEVLPEQVDFVPVYLFADRENLTLRSILKWVMNAPKLAEELDINQQNYNEYLTSKDPVITNLLGTEPKLWKAFGLEPDWVQIILREHGNYGEIFNASLGNKSPFKIKRELNNLQKNNGLITSVPFL